MALKPNYCLKWQQEFSREAGTTEKKWNYKALDLGISRKREWNNNIDHKVCDTLYKGWAPSGRKSFRKEKIKRFEQECRAEARSEETTDRKVGLIYLSSSGATCSTKILGFGEVLWGKELEHVEGQEEEVEEELSRVRTPGDFISKKPYI